MKPNTPVFLIKPKYIFKTPFLKYDLQNPTNREAQNEELTEYFNYGFNEDTMNIYVKLVNRTLKVLDYKKNLEYFDEPSELMRLNDQIPMDLGGFGKFYDPQVFKNDFIQNDQQLLKNFLFNIVKATWINGKQYPTYPMLEFVKSMYPPKKVEKDSEQNNQEVEENPLTMMVEHISKNLEKKYEQTMRKLIEQKNQPKQVYPSNLPFKKGSKFQRRPKIEVASQEKTKERVEVTKKKEKKQRRSSSSSSSSSSSGSSSGSSSSSESQDARRKRHKERRQRDSRKDSRKEKRSKSKSKDQKVKKQKKESRKQSRHDQRRDSRKDSRHQSRHDRRDSRQDDKDRVRDKSKKRSDNRSRSRDHRSHRR